MPKIKANSVDYNSLIGADFKNVASRKHDARHISPRVFPLFLALIGLLIVGVVLAKSVPTLSTKKAAANNNVETLTLALKPVDNSITPVIGGDENPFANSQEVSLVDDIYATNVQPVNRITVVVKKGDTLSSIFNDLDIHSELTRVMNLGKEAKPLRKIYPGQKLHFTLNQDGIETLELEKSITKSLVFNRDDETFIIEELDRELDRLTQVSNGVINQSLFLAGQNAGMSDGLIMDLAAIFGWDIDFALDIRQGDSFTILYEELYLNGEKVADGDIIAAEFTNNKNTYRAYRYTDSNNKTEYYAPDGKSMRKPFMRTPVALGRISSYFNLKRKHPILNKIRAHKGVDYAAPTGTAIKATGDGKVIHRGNKGGYGKTIILRHGSTYTTLYAHMSKYARGTGVGSRVRQGQIIGYIGRTGLATGPHLHYEFRVNGVHRNPLKVKLPSASPLPDSEMLTFQASIQPLVVQLDAYSSSALVMRDL